jgi:hypothetical protein
MSRWPQSANRVLEIVSGSPDCAVCGAPADRFATVTWGLGHHSDHPVCEDHLRQYRVDYDSLARSLRRLAAKSRSEA